MPAIFDALPGIDVPVGSISKSLTKMWEDTAAQGGPAPANSDSTATQVNFVLHLGLRSTAEDAQVQFQTAVRFSRRYPSRVVVLCPSREDSEPEIRAKIYGECTLGKSKGDTRCCEFVILSYPYSARRFLENQVSISLSTDLPLYYWAHAFSDSVRLADYRYLLTRAKRVLFDSAAAPEDAMGYPWPKPEVVRDLAYARLLPIRQSIGQFLSRYEMDTLCQGLLEVTVTAGGALHPEAKVLLGWVRTKISLCGQNRALFDLVSPPGAPERSLGVTFTYEGAKAFAWNGDLATGLGLFEADFGSGKTVLPTGASLLSAESALSEAMFF